MKPLQTIAGAALLALAASAAQAQTAPAPADGGQPRAAAPADREPGRRPPLTAADREAFTDARIAGIQAGLKLSADQQRLWPPLEQAIRAQAAARAARIEARLARMQERRQRREERQAARPDLMQRLEQRAERADRRADQVEKRAETLQGLVAALRPFWASLNEDQRRILPILMRDRESRRAGRDRRHGPMHHGMHHPGPRP
jgi:hypothetical protein